MCAVEIKEDQQQSLFINWLASKLPLSQAVSQFCNQSELSREGGQVAEFIYDLGHQGRSPDFEIFVLQAHLVDNQTATANLGKMLQDLADQMRRDPKIEKAFSRLSIIDQLSQKVGVNQITLTLRPGALGTHIITEALISA